MGKKRKLQKKNYASFYRLAGGRIKPPMDKSLASSGRTDNDLKREKIPRVTHGTDLSQRDHV